MPASMMWTEHTPTSMGLAETTSPRYEIPWQVYAWDDNEPEFGGCWNCGHMAEVNLGGKTYLLCVYERDADASGDVVEIDPDTRECSTWTEG